MTPNLTEAGPPRSGWPLRAALLAGLLLVCACIGAGILVYRTSEADRWVSHTVEVRATGQRLLRLLSDAEAAQRGYLLVDDPALLDTVDTMPADLPALRDRLRQDTRDNPEQQQRLDALDALIDAKLAVLQRMVDQQQDGDRLAALATFRAGEGRDLMDEIRALMDGFDMTEAALLRERQQAARTERDLLTGAILTSAAAAGLLAAFVILGMRRQAQEIDAANRSLADKNAALEREIHEREAAETRLRQIQKMETIGQLTGGIAHDFNNMLSIIVGSLDLVLRRADAGDSRLRRLVGNAMDGARRASQLTQRLLAYSRLQSLDPKPVDANKCVSDMSELLQRTLGEAIAIETVLAGGLWRAYIDAPQLESALLNLAINARDAMPKGGKLTIETSNAHLDAAYAAEHEEVTPGQYVLIAVTDTGTGMPPEVIARAFEPFYTTKPTGSGTGLGLSQVHGFVKQSHGHIKIYSELGVGTTVKLYLPRDTAPDRPVAASPAAPAPRRTGVGAKPLVLVVEDEPKVREFALDALETLGFRAMAAADGPAGLALLDQQPDITVLLTDVVMPGMNGRQLADQALARRPQLRVLFMTGYTRNAIVHNGTLDAGTHLLSKPFTVTQLGMELERVLGGRNGG